MALTIPKPLFTTLVISSLCIPFFTGITVYNKTFPWNILLPAFSIILDAVLNILLIFFFPPNSVPQAPSLWAKILVDVMINFGSAAIQTLSPRSLVYLLMSNFALIYLITLLLVVKSTNFALLDLFIAITPFLQYFGEQRMFWLLIPSSILLGVLICARNNNEIITVSMCIAKNSVNFLGIKAKNLLDSLRDSLRFIWKRVVKNEVGEEAAAAEGDHVAIPVAAEVVDDSGDRASDESAVTVGVGVGAIAVAIGGADERHGDDGAIQIGGAPDGDASELVGDFEEVAGVDDGFGNYEVDDDDGAIQIGGAPAGEFGNNEADDDDGAIQTDEAPTGDAYERVGDAEDAGGVDDGFGNYEAGDDDEAIQIGGAPAGEFGNYEADDDDDAIQTDEASTGDAYEWVGDAEDAGGVDDGFGNYEAEYGNGAIQTGGAPAGTGVTIAYSAVEQDGDGDDAGGVDDVVADDEADYGGAGIDKDL